MEFFDARRVVAHPNLSLASGAIKGWDRRNHFYYSMLNSLAQHYGFDVEAPWEMLDEATQRLILQGSGKEKIGFHYMTERGRSQLREHAFEGVLPNLERRYRETESTVVREELAKFRNVQPCPGCAGTRLRREARHVRLAGRAIYEVSRMPLREARAFFRSLALEEIGRASCRERV